MNDYRLRCSITLLQQRNGLTKGRRIKQVSLSSQWRHHSNDKENIPTFSTTQQESKRSTCTPTSTTIIDEHKQIVRRRLHNNFPSQKTKELQFMKKEHLQSLQAIHRCSKGAKKREITYGLCQQMKKKARKKQTMYTTYHQQNKAYIIYMQQQDSQLKANG